MLRGRRLLGRRLLGLALGALALAGRPPAQAPRDPEAVLVVVPELFRTRVEGPLRRLAASAEVVAAEAWLAGPHESPGILLLWDEWTLARFAATDALAELPDFGPDAAPGPRDAASRFVLPFAVEYAVFTAAGVPGRAAWRWEELALHPDLHDRLGVVGPEVDGGLWLSMLRQRLAQGESEPSGLALWTTVDARAGRLARSYEAALGDFRSGRIAAVVAPRATLGAEGPWPEGTRAERFSPPAVGRLGLAVGRGAGNPARAFATRIVGTALPEIAAAVGAVRADPQPLALDPVQAVVWWGRFEANVRGRGRAVEQLADWLDLGFGLLFLAAVLFFWRHHRRRSPVPDGKAAARGAGRP